ncbi:MAG: 50S ribosomal protein L22 [candidate division TM6 bacterium GW2011_GWF2_43_17]|nr:MAG: 50S ribosomal protein L22 [candidate division TM6 bacterium GW2011_GWF2_43_17]HAU30139.1 50S ribosomal protein L22 [Candidatus Dependentiae bacterium]
MQFKAQTRYIWYSPYKLRLLADVIRGKDVVSAMQWLSMYKVKRTVPVYKTLKSAVANAKDRENHEPRDLVVAEVRVDQGPIRHYFKPGAQGRSVPLRARQSHITIVVAPRTDVEKTKNKKNKLAKEA